MDETVNSKLLEIVGKEDLATGTLERRLYSHDAAPIPRLVSSLFKTLPDAIVRPESTKEVSHILRLAWEHGIPVIPRAAASYSLGGVIPVKGGIVLDLVKLNRIGALSVDESWIEVDAGVVFKDLMEHLSRKGLSVFSYPTSAPSATVGGWISTGGYGIGTLKYGPVWEQVKELEVVTPTGEIVTVSWDTTYPKIDWFFGTEGQLGIITKIKLGIHRKPENLAIHGVYVIGNKELAGLAGALSELKETPYLLTIMDANLVSLKNALGEKKLEEGKNLVLAVFEDSVSSAYSSTRDTFDSIIKERKLAEIDKGLAGAEIEELFFPMRIGRLGPTLLAAEVIVPIDQLASVLDKIQSLRKKQNLRMGIESQVISKDSVLILAMYLADERKPFNYFTHLGLVKDITSIGLSHEGRPYGTGLWNAIYIKKRFEKERLKELKEAKERLDPAGIMNPGKFFKVQTRFGLPVNRVSYSLFMSILSLAHQFQRGDNHGNHRT